MLCCAVLPAVYNGCILHGVRGSCGHTACLQAVPAWLGRSRAWCVCVGGVLMGVCQGLPVRMLVPPVPLSV